MIAKIIKTTGEEKEVHFDNPNTIIEQLEKECNCGGFDTVNLRDGRIMLVDDNGYESKIVDRGNNHLEIVPLKGRKAVNAKATQLYLSVCVPGTTHQIVGDVAIVNDIDMR